jgi:tripartite-type tricarboxylate transporter receptor subunit TctC
MPVLLVRSLPPKLLLAWALAWSALGLVDARAEWPEAGIRLVVPFPPGGAPDALARLVSERLAASLKQNIVIENRPGAGGTIATSQTARAKPDGYTLLLAGLSTHVIGPLVNSNADYDPLKDFSHIAFIGGPAMVLISTPSAGIKSIDDLVREAKAGRISAYTTLGPGTIGHLLMEHICKKAGITLTHVPFTQVPLSEVITGRVPVGAFAWGAVLGQVQAGKVTAFAVGTAERLKQFPDVPTFKEQGFAFTPSTWVSLAAPAGVDPNVVRKLNEEVRRIVTLPEVRERLDREAAEVRQISPQELVELFRSETAAWRPIAEQSGLRKK